MGAKMSETRANETGMYRNTYHLIILISPSPAIWIHIWVLPNMVHVPKPCSLLKFTCSNFDDFGYPYIGHLYLLPQRATVEHLSYLLLFVDVIRHGFGIGDLLLSRDFK